MLQSELFPRLGNSILPQSQHVGAGLERKPVSQTQPTRLRNSVTRHAVFACDACHHLVANHQIRLKRRETDHQRVPVWHDQHQRRNTNRNGMADRWVCIRDWWNNRERVEPGIRCCRSFRWAGAAADAGCCQKNKDAQVSHRRSQPPRLKLIDSSHEERGLQPQRDGGVRWRAWSVQQS